MDKNRLLWGAMAQFEKIGARRMLKLKRRFDNPESLLNATRAQLISAGLEEPVAGAFVDWRKNLDLKLFEEKILTEKINILLPGDADYPALLRETSDPPQTLFVRGQINSLRSPLAVVGTRKMSIYGRRVIENLVTPLSKCGLSIVSGLALGIDAWAHKSAVEAGGHTVAVLGSGVDDGSIYPSSNKSLAARIIASGGAIISEFAPNSPSYKHHFPIRNRIIAGMSLGVLVIEADIDSGSLITAKSALEENRDVFAVPGDIFRDTSRGTNNLLKLGARLVNAPEDVAEVLGIKTSFRPVPLAAPESPEEAAVMLCLKKDPRHINALVKESELDISTVSAMLTFLEMKGTARHIGGMNYVLAR